MDLYHISAEGGIRFAACRAGPLGSCLVLPPTGQARREANKKASVGFTPVGPRLTATYLASVGFTPAGPRLIATQGGAIPLLFFLLPP
jgi:hypothetical protein